jgi:hypothetical protein
LVENRVSYATSSLFSHFEFAHLLPQDFISTFNSTLFQLEKEISDPKLLRLGWPIPEFAKNNKGNTRHSVTANAIETPPLDWNNEESINSIISQLRKLKLPAFHELPKNSYSNVLYSIRDYSSKLTKNIKTQSSQLVKIVSEHFQRENSKFPWNQVFEVLYYYRINEIENNALVYVFPNGQRLYDKFPATDYQPIKRSKVEEDMEEEEIIPDAEITVSKKRR